MKSGPCPNRFQSNHSKSGNFIDMLQKSILTETSHCENMQYEIHVVYMIILFFQQYKICKLKMYIKYVKNSLIMRVRNKKSEISSLYLA